MHFSYEDKEDMFDAHSYNKGGAVLHMLRKIIGDDAFYAGMERTKLDAGASVVGGSVAQRDRSTTDIGVEVGLSFLRALLPVARIGDASRVLRIWVSAMRLSQNVSWGRTRLVLNE